MFTDREALALSLIFQECGIGGKLGEPEELAKGVIFFLSEVGWGRKNVNTNGPRTPAEIVFLGAEVKAAFNKAGYKIPDDNQVERLLHHMVKIGLAPPPLPLVPTAASSSRNEPTR